MNVMLAIEDVQPTPAAPFPVSVAAVQVEEIAGQYWACWPDARGRGRAAWHAHRLGTTTFSGKTWRLWACNGDEAIFRALKSVGVNVFTMSELAAGGAGAREALKTVWPWWECEGSVTVTDKDGKDATVPLVGRFSYQFVGPPAVGTDGRYTITVMHRPTIGAMPAGQVEDYSGADAQVRS